jgi:hypothetical protein
MTTADLLIPTQLGDDSSSLPVDETTIIKRIDTSGNYNSSDVISGMGCNDSILYPAFLNTEEANKVFNTLMKEEEFRFQQWYHMPHAKTGHLEPLRRVKISMATPNSEGLIPHYRFPVNDQVGLCRFS